MKHPWELNPMLTQEHIETLSKFIQNVRNAVIDLHDPDLGDTARGTGMRAYECVRRRIVKECASGLWPWLRIIKPDGRFSFAINSVPIRLYKGDPRNPGERRLLTCAAQARQMELLEAEVGDYAQINWLFVIEVDHNEYVDRISLTGYLNGVQVSCWEVPLAPSVPVVAPVDEELPQETSKPKAVASVKKKRVKTPEK